MFKFNNTNIFTGYIKQLLASTNLPQYRIYTKANEAYFNRYGVESPEIIKTIKYKDATYNADNNEVIRYAKYIKNGQIQEYVKQGDTNVYKWEPCKKSTVSPVQTAASKTKPTDLSLKSTVHNHTYFPDKFELNSTRNFKIKNNIYDSYTHEYLGDYLRFQRDYYNLDLMGLYNCFSNTLVDNLNIKLTNNKNNYIENIIFNTNDKNYKFYIVPVKFFKSYTVAIDSNLPVEVCCCMYQKYFEQNKPNEILIKSTYKKYNSLKFDSPILYDLLSIDNFGSDINATGSEAYNSQVDSNVSWKNELLQNEKILKLVIKLPVSNNSSITILEGDFTKNNNRLYIKENKTAANPADITSYWLKLTNRVITNYEEDYYEAACDNFKPITPLQLLQLNSGISYPFANTLVEYLIGNAITHLDTIPNNIKRVQKILALNNYKVNQDGNWQPEIQPMIYDYLTSDEELKNFGPEVFGYVDKNAETNVKYVNKENNISISISGVELDPEEKIDYGRYH